MPLLDLESSRDGECLETAGKTEDQSKGARKAQNYGWGGMEPSSNKDTAKTIDEQDKGNLRNL